MTGRALWWAAVIGTPCAVCILLYPDAGWAFALAAVALVGARQAVMQWWSGEPARHARRDAAELDLGLMAELPIPARRAQHGPIIPADPILPPVPGAVEPGMLIVTCFRAGCEQTEWQPLSHAVLQEGYAQAEATCNGCGRPVLVDLDDTQADAMIRAELWGAR